MIKYLKKLIKIFFLKYNINFNLFTSKIEIINFIKLFKVKIPKNIELIRIGSKHDGGYLIPNILNEICYCYSAGIGKNINFEKDLSKYRINSFGADGTIKELPENIPNYNFIKKNIGFTDDEKNIRFETWVSSNTDNNNSLIAQIDIEGGEYNLILDTPLKTFEKFKVIVIEFHNFSNISNKIIYDFYYKSINKILIKFNICHLHINNAEKPIKINGIRIPPLLEITFLRKDFYKDELKSVRLPNKLDSKNLVNKKDYNFDKNWMNLII